MDLQRFPGLEIRDWHLVIQSCKKVVASDTDETHTEALPPEGILPTARVAQPLARVGEIDRLARAP